MDMEQHQWSIVAGQTATTDSTTMMQTVIRTHQWTAMFGGNIFRKALFRLFKETTSTDQQSFDPSVNPFEESLNGSDVQQETTALLPSCWG